jgi:glycosyltransferase involved in cell wall biosynthesis
MPASPPTRLLYVIGTLEVGGTERQLVALCTGLDRRRFAPSVCCLAQGGPLAAELGRAGIPVTVVPFKGLTALRNPLAAGGRLCELVALMRRERPALVHAFLPHANGLGALAARLARVPAVVISLRGLAPGPPLWGRLAGRLADRVVANAEAVGAYALSHDGVSAAKLRIVRNGLDLGAFDQQAGAPAPALPSGPLVATVANPNRFKAPGLLVLVEAAARVLRQVPAVRFLLVGDGPARAEIARAAAARGLGDRLICLGSRQDVAAILAACQVMVLPSLREGLPNAILEAMAARKPVIATRVGGIPEAVVDDTTGLLVPPGDPEALANAILTLLQDPRRAETMGAAGRIRAEREFALERMIAETVRVYAEILGLQIG